MYYENLSKHYGCEVVMITSIISMICVIFNSAIQYQVPNSSKVCINLLEIHSIFLAVSIFLRLIEIFNENSTICFLRYSCEVVAFLGLSIVWIRTVFYESFNELEDLFGYKSILAGFLLFDSFFIGLYFLTGFFNKNCTVIGSIWQPFRSSKKKQ